MEQCRALRLNDHSMLMRHWFAHPPLQVMIQAFLGIESKGQRRQVEAAPIEQFMAAWQGAGGNIG